MTTDPRTVTALMEKAVIKNLSKRKCTDCGKPTHNYRCEACWKKKRGYGFGDSGDEGLVTAEARERMQLNGAAAKREKKEAKKGEKDWFVPLTKYGKSPPPPPPGEQKRLMPGMPAKGHAKQRQPLQTTFGCLKNATRRNPWTESSLTRNSRTLSA